MLKLLDKLLFNRIWPKIRQAVYPWGAGGVFGADLTAWLATEFLALQRGAQPACATYAAFIDGESAYCRPPAAAVLEALRLVEGLVNSDI